TPSKKALQTSTFPALRASVPTQSINLTDPLPEPHQIRWRVNKRDGKERHEKHPNAFFLNAEVALVSPRPRPYGVLNRMTLLTLNIVFGDRRKSRGCKVQREINPPVA